MIGAGVAARLVAAFATVGVDFDIGNFNVVDEALRHDGLNAYSAINAGYDPGEALRWPYLPGYFPFVLLSGLASRGLGLEFHGVIQIWPIAADAAVACLVQAYLGRRGASDATRLLAAGLVLFGPAFAVVSGFHGQLDSVAILPAVAALYLWDRLPDGTGRAAAAGLLIGLGIALKTVPGLMLFALLPACRTRREAGVLVAAAAAVPLVVTAPFLLADPDGVRAIADYRGVPGQAGLALGAQPDLARFWLNGDAVAVSGAASWLIDHATLLLALPMAAAVGLLLRRRPDPAVAASLLWLVFFAFSPSLLLHYVVWGLPFFLMAGFARQVLALQAFLLVPIVLRYRVIVEGPWDSDALGTTYAVLMIATTIMALAALVVLVLRIRHPLAGASPGSERVA